MKLYIGIISYLPDEIEARNLRIERLDRLIFQLKEIFPQVPIRIIAQNWKDYSNSYQYLEVQSYKTLGILKARETLRYDLLYHTDGDYFILFDDDAIIEYTKEAIDELYRLMDLNPKGFAFRKGGHNKYNPFADSQLNFAVFSRAMLQNEGVPKVDPQKDIGFEDRVWTMLMHVKYANYEFDLPVDIKCTHFRNPNEPAPSTWSKTRKRSWKFMRENTLGLEEYIITNKDLPTSYRGTK